MAPTATTATSVGVDPSFSTLRIVTRTWISVSRRERERVGGTVSSVFGKDVQVFVDRTGVDSLFQTSSASERGKKSGDANVIVSLNVLRRSYRRSDGSVPSIYQQGVSKRL